MLINVASCCDIMLYKYLWRDIIARNPTKTKGNLAK
jgi:hypothetical protein